MIQPPIGKKVLVEVPSTTANIGPGFDCLGAALGLSNHFTITRIEGDSQRFELIMESTEGNHLRGGPENLFYRAAQRVWKAAGLEPVGLEAGGEAEAEQFAVTQAEPQMEEPAEEEEVMSEQEEVGDIAPDDDEMIAATPEEEKEKENQEN